MFGRLAPAVVLALAALAPAPPQDPPKAQDDRDPFRVHIRMHRKVAPKIVQVRGDGQVGTGVIIRGDGLILSSPTACGLKRSTAWVILPGNRRVEAQVVGRRNDLEAVLLKIDAKDLPVMEFADSTKARIGQVAYAFGDVWDSIGTDDQVAMSLGIVSGLYDVTATQMNSLYTGPVIETSAAVNQNLDGGPLVDGEGRMLGMITLNYHPAKFTGIAVPAHVLKPEVDRMIKEYAEGPVAREPGIIGIVVEENSDAFTGVRITHITPGGPAEKGKPHPLMAGDEILRIDGVRVTTWDKCEELTRDIKAGARVQFRVKRDSREITTFVTAGRRTEPPAKKDY